MNFCEKKIGVLVEVQRPSTSLGDFSKKKRLKKPAEQLQHRPHEATRAAGVAADAFELQRRKLRGKTEAWPYPDGPNLSLDA